MPWIADAYTAIGKSHLLCEDYVLADSNQPSIIVCDGCSSSKHSDLGARLLAHSAKRTLELLSVDIDTQVFGTVTISNAMNSLKALDASLSLNALEATLLVAAQLKNRLRVYAYGDGLVAAMRDDGQLEVFRFLAKDNAPYYLTYWVDGARAEKYQYKFGDESLKQETIVNENIFVQTASQYGTILDFDEESYKCLFLSTDGLETFINPGTGHEIHLLEVLKNVTQFKLRKGAFIQRRIRREIKCLTRDGFVHVDDIGVAALLKN